MNRDHCSSCEHSASPFSGYGSFWWPYRPLVARVEKALHRRGAFTEIMGKVLDFCRQRRLLAEVEDEIASYPEFKYADHGQAAIAFSLLPR